jgi:DNA invertase Pin-like site-specific DNA recombinase
MKKVALYTRVSTDKQTNENQSIKLIEYAKRCGLEYDLFEEKESSRKTRPIKQHVLQSLRSGVYSGVIVWRLDRWARSSTELILEVDELQKRDIGFTSVSDNLNFDSAGGRLQFQILAAFAEFERNLISERTKEGLARAKLKGNVPGRPKGSKDKRRRKKSGYILKEAKKRQKIDMKRGEYKPIEDYLDNDEDRKRPIITPPNIKGGLRTN